MDVLPGVRWVALVLLLLPLLTLLSRLYLGAHHLTDALTSVVYAEHLARGRGRAGAAAGLDELDQRSNGVASVLNVRAARLVWSDVEFEEYVAARGRALERYAYVLAGDAHLAQDLTQTALVKAYRRWSWVARADQPDQYVRRILTTSFIDRARKRSSAERPVAGIRRASRTATRPR